MYFDGHFRKIRNFVKEDDTLAVICGAIFNVLDSGSRKSKGTLIKKYQGAEN